jgi:DNA-binding NtrC family response regulator
MPLQILVVNPDRDALAIMGAALKAWGFVPTLADDFEDATALLKTGEFPILVTAERLGPHNGLHLVLRARAARPTVGAIVTTLTTDPVLAAEAAMFGALSVVSPWESPNEFLGALNLLKDAQPT